jgi:hypothetical protein
VRFQFFHVRFVIEGLVGMGLIIGEGFPRGGAALLFLIGELVESAKRVLDALHRAERIFGSEL